MFQNAYFLYQCRLFVLLALFLENFKKYFEYHDHLYANAWSMGKHTVSILFLKLIVELFVVWWAIDYDPRTNAAARATVASHDRPLFVSILYKLHRCSFSITSTGKRLFLIFSRCFFFSDSFLSKISKCHLWERTTKPPKACKCGATPWWKKFLSTKWEKSFQNVCVNRKVIHWRD